MPELAEGKADVALIYEPWVYRGQVGGLTNLGEQLILLHPKTMQDPVFISGII
jgi:hypothetical protein